MNSFTFNQRIYNTFSYKNEVYVEVFDVPTFTELVKITEGNKVYSTLLLKDFSELFHKGQQLIFCKFAAASQGVKLNADELLILNQNDSKYYNSAEYGNRKPMESSTYYVPNADIKPKPLDLLDPNNYNLATTKKANNEIADAVNTFLFG